MVGASGAIMGLFGAAFALFLHGWRRDAFSIARSQFLLFLAIFLMQTTFDMLTPQVAGTVHLMGIFIGFIMGLFLVKTIHKPSQQTST